MVFKKGHVPWSMGLTKEIDIRLKKISLINSKQNPSEEIRKKISDKAKERYKDPTQNPMYGNAHSEETKRKMSKTRKRKMISGEIIIWSKGKKLSKIHKKRVSDSIKKRWDDPDYREWQRKINSGKNNPMYGIKGENHHNWLGGVSFEDYPPEFNDELKNKIKERDKYRCQYPRCNDIKDLTIHHIDYNKKNNKKINLITLCRIHNSVVNGKRKHWKNFFIDLLRENA